MNLKAILDAALSECGFPPEALYAASPNPSAKQIFDLANRELKVVSKHPWQALRKSHEITLTSATEYDLPSDFRQFVSGTVWSQGLVRPVELPTSDPVWGYLKSRAVDGLRYRARVIGDKLQVNSPQVGDVIRFDYVSSSAATDYLAAPIERFSNDKDLFLLDDDLLIMGVVWRFKRAKGFEDWQADKIEYDNYKRSLMGTDSGARTLNLGQTVESPPFAPQIDTWQ